MKLRKTINTFGSATLLITALLFSFSSSAEHHGDKKKDIIDTALAAGSFNTLAMALTKADLIETLKGDGPFTVFAPTDDAFAKMPAEDLNEILADKARLTSLLTYHVVVGTIMSSDAVRLNSANTVEGRSVSINARNGMKVNKANVIKADIKTSNGVIHIIDTVLIPGG